MEVGSLFNSGILGQSFNWWIGQIADDSTWRENINPGKFEDKEAVPGWGYRYKVAIMGLHPQSTETLPSEQLSWATVMYPTTSGGGQSGAFATPALRQGNVVFGFFMDGGQEQVPVIMGVLGNNLQTPLQTKTEESGGLRYSGTSGYAEPKIPKKEAKENVPESDMTISKPGSKEQGIEKSVLSAMGLGGGGGGTDSLTEQAKTKTIRSYIGDGLQELVGRTPARLRRDDQYE